MKLNKKAEVTLAIFLVAAAVAFVFALSIPDQSNSITGMAVAGANISGCANISIDSELTQDIYVNLSDAIGSWCISFQTNDIILDCQGHSLNGNGSGIGIISGNLDNITIKNCQVNNFTSGIQMRTNNSFVINNTASFNTEDGFIIGYGYYGVINAFVENNTAINNSRHPFYIINASYSQIKNNRAYNHSNGVYNIQSSHYNQILNNLAYDNYGGFTLSYSSHDNHLFNNTVHNNQVFNGNSYEFITDSYNNVLNQSYYTGNSTVVNLRVGQSFTDNAEVTVVDTSLGRYWFRNAKFTYINSSAGEVSFITRLNVTSPFPNFPILYNDIQITHNRIYVNASSQSSSLNKSANLTFYNIFHYDPQPLVDITDSGSYIPCNSSVCTELYYNRTSQIYKYNVTHFTLYSSNESVPTFPLYLDFDYNLTQNLSGNGTGIYINSSNIVLDCQGHTITGNGSNYGIDTNNYNNITIQNCIIQNFGAGIYNTGANNTFKNNQLYYNSLLTDYFGGIYSVGSNASIINNTATNNKHGIHIYTGNNNLITNNTATNNNESGFYISASDDNLIINNTANSNKVRGIYILDYCEDNNITNNTVNSNLLYGIQIENSNLRIIVKDNQASSNTRADLRIHESEVDVFGPFLVSYEFVSTKNISFINSSFVKLKFTTNITENGTNLNQDIQINNNSIYVNSSGQPGFNATANLTFYNTNYTVPKASYSPWDNGTFIGCPSNICQNIQYISQDLIYDVTQFTTYSTQENSAPSPVNLVSPVNNSNLTNNQPTFNWTNASDFDNDLITFYLEVSNSSSFTSLIINQSTSNIYYTLSSNLSDGVYYWRVNACDSYLCTYSAQNWTFLIDINPPTSTITTLTNNSDLGKNSFPINISGTASDGGGIDYVQVNINGTFYNATGTTNWNYSWTPTIDDEYPIYSRAVDTSGNNETQFEIYYIEVYTTSNLTNMTKTNSDNINSDLFNSIENDSDINISTIDWSEFLNVTSYNCTINNSDLNHSECYDSIITDSTGSGWYVDPSNITNVTGNNNNFTNANVSHSTVDNSNVSDSEVTLSNITSSSIVNNSDVSNSNITNSHVDYSNVTDSDIDDSTINNSNVTDSVIDDSIIIDSTVEDSIVNNSNVTNSTVDNSNVTDSTIDNSNITNSDIEDSNITNSNITDSTIINSNVTDSNINNSNIENSTVTNSTFNNVTVINSNVTDMVLNNTNISNDYCQSGTIVYLGVTYTCPISLSNVYSPPPPPAPSGGGGGIRRYQCNDNRDNDGDDLIDYPEDPGCLDRDDNNETDPPCQQSWICVSWSECLEGKQTRTCTDENQCQEKFDAGQVEGITLVEKPAEEKDCLPVILEVECQVNTDCPENYQCENNQCILIPEREPILPKTFLSKFKDFLKKLLDLNVKIDQKVASARKTALLSISDLIKFNYSPFIIAILIIGVLISGYFAYRSFIAAGHLEAWQQRKIQIEKSKFEKEKARAQEKQIQEKQELEKASQQLSYFIRDSLFAGYPSQQIKDSLVAKGWPNKIVSQYINKIYQANKEHFGQIRQSVKIEKEMQRLTQEIKSPQKGIKYPEPTLIKEPLPKPFILKPKPLKETKQTKLLAEELTQIEKQLQKPAVPVYEKPIITKPITPSKNSIEKLKETILDLSQQGKTKDDIIQKLVKENWPEEFLHHFIQKYFPHLEHISFFKKEVTALEKTLKKLKPGDKK